MTTALWIALTVVSCWLTWVGLREKNLPQILIGTGLGMPTFDLADARFWVAGGLFCVVGLYLRVRLD